MYAIRSYYAIEASTLGDATSSATNKSGGLIKVGDVNADTTVNGTARAYVGSGTAGNYQAAGVVINAGGNFILNATTDVKAKGHSEAKGGGARNNFV